MTRRTTFGVVLAAAIAALALGASAGPRAPRASVRPLPDAPHLAVHVGGAWRTWWRGDSAPARWDDRAPVLARVARWRTASDGVEWTELALAGTGEAWRTRLVVARVDPARVRLALDTAWDANGDAAWRVDRAPAEARLADARLAVNAGQFVAALPWGWVVLDGRRFLSPGRGPLVTTVAIDDAGRVLWRHGGTLPDSSGGAPRWAFQSYPTLLADAVVPPALRASRADTVTAPDLAHRDARVAIGRLADGRVAVALTRWDAAGSTLGAVPFGLTVPEIAAVMGALGARDAVLLDGGISGQLMLRDTTGRVHAWNGMRAVPLALVVRSR